MRFRLSFTLLSLAAAVLPAAASAQTVTVTGTVRIAHADTLVPPSTEHTYLVTPKETVELDPAGHRLDLVPGTRVRVTGDRGPGGVVSLEGGGVEPVVRPGVETLAPLSKQTGTIRTLALIAAPDAVTPGTTPAAVNSVLFGATGSLDAFYSEQSNGNLRFAGDVAQVSVGSTPTAGCPWQNWASAAQIAAQDAGYVLANYDEFVYFFYGIQGCGFAGVAYVGGPGAHMNGTTDLRVVAHEVGHNLGSWHAGTLACKNSVGAVVPLADHCTAQEYGSQFDVMGSTLRQLNAPNRVAAHLLDENAIKTVSGDGMYRIGPLESATGIRALRIPRASGQNMYVELRRPFGAFDTWAATDDLINGVLLNEDHIDSDGNGVPDAYHSGLVSTGAPLTAGNTKARLQQGQTFADSDKSITVTLVSVDDLGAVVRVTMPVGTDTQAPTVPGNVVVSPLSTTQLQVTWSDSTDNAGVSSYTVALNGVTAATVTGTSVVLDGLAPGTTSTVTVRAADNAGNVSASSAPVSGTTNTPPAVTPPPPTLTPAAPSAKTRIPAAPLDPAALTTPAAAEKSVRVSLVDVHRFGRIVTVKLAATGATKCRYRKNGRRWRVCTVDRNGSAIITVRRPKRHARVKVLIELTSATGERTLVRRTVRH